MSKQHTHIKNNTYITKLKQTKAQQVGNKHEFIEITN